MSDQALDAAEERRRRRELRQKRILENSGQRLGKILGSPPDASESLAESVGDGAEVARRAPAFDGANPSAYLAANQEVLQADPASSTGGRGDLFDMLLKTMGEDQAAGGGGAGGGQEEIEPDNSFKAILTNFFSKWFWLALGILTYAILASPDHSWMVGESSGSVFSAAFCLHLILVKLNVIYAKPKSPGGRNRNMNLDQILIMVLPSMGLASQDKIHQFVDIKNHLMSFAEKWSSFYAPFLVMRVVNGAFS